ncbi:hypothetical protein KOI35_16870 [Actinoplanes bogorensis]|uniref:Uncharacterized protein n=1 Tax=Paractinoplanes bogorensis TaxID=1610840 RepID=A0ABS5YNY5_9ACTN|nr:hypothetical protein [Actinoplanes bogorensis]MBU2665177.1 hypothetical protein [Actinoplanes bogorensis]
MPVGRPRVVVHERRAWFDVEKWCRTILDAWPQVDGMAGLDDVTATIGSARWDLARLLAEKSELVSVRNEATFAQYGFAWEDPLRRELAARRDQVAQRLAALEEEIDRRTSRLRTLAEQCAHLTRRPAPARQLSKREQRALRAIERADSVILDTAPWDVRTDPATDLSAQTSAVLTAYRELAGS